MKVVTIEYCTSWGYTPKAVSLASVFLENKKTAIKELKIIPSTGGVFEVTLDGQLIYSKKETGAFPTDVEIKALTQKI